MAVYVDDMRKPVRLNRRTANWSHLYADTSQELHDFAAELGLRAVWLQYAGTWKEHYDVTDTTRKEAIKKGAIAVTYRETARYMQERKNATKTS